MRGNKLKKIVSTVLVITIILLCASFKAEAVSQPKVSKTLIIQEGKDKIIKVSGQRIKSKSFLSSDAKVAKVTSKGKVIAMKAGTCVVTVSVKYKKNKRAKKLIKKTFFCAVTVKPGSTPPTETPETDGYKVKEYYIKKKQKNEFELSLELSGRVVAVLPIKEIGKAEKRGKEIEVSELKAGQKIVVAFEISTLSFPEEIVNCKVVEVLE
ncbi:hypothetical protein D7V82_15145 [bacterium 1xD8-6]|nr:hypothetical protein D7V82_15145 [bacterium 1xD8-6]